MTEQHPSHVTFRRENGVGWVELNRPDTLNALSNQMRRELQQLWRDLRHDPEVRCIVLTGSGEKAFCTGIDRSELPDEAGEFNAYAYDDLGAEVSPKQNGLWKPVIAAVNGIACGGAFYLLGDSDFLVASETATFFDPHVSFGMAAVYEPILMYGRMAFGDLMRMSLVGLDERLSARAALESGLLTEVVPADRLHDVVREIAEGIAAHPTEPVQATVRSLWTARQLGVMGATEMANPLLATGTRTELLDDGQSRFRGGSSTTPRIR